MAVSRPLVLVLIGAVLLAATFMVTQRPADDAGNGPVAAQPQPAAKPEQNKSATADKADRGADKAAAKREQAAQSRAEKQREAKAAAEERKINKVIEQLPAVGPREDAGNSVGLPMDVARALAREKTVVLFFSQGGSDDVATSKSVRSLRGNRRVEVFTEKLDALPNYRRIVAGLGVSEAPSIVIVGHDLKARLIEGYVDAGSLRQHIDDLG
jgi:hypothetical protein